jgi:uncharacterized OB-fold protein
VTKNIPGNEGPLRQRPLPVSDAATAPYWNAANKGRFVMPRCTQCTRWHFYPRALCPHCSSAELYWADCSGRGTVYSYTVVYRAPSPAFAAAVPYVIAIIAIEEGPHLMSNVVNCPPDALRIGLGVRAVFLRVAGDVQLPVFEPADGAA